MSAAEGVEAGVQSCAEGGDAAGDLGAQSGEGGLAGFAGALGLGGDVGAHLREGAANVLVERLIAGIETGELVGNLGEAGVLYRGSRACAGAGR